MGTPRVGPHQQKPGVNAIFSLKPSTSSNAAINIPALNDFLLFPQAVPSRISSLLESPGDLPDPGINPGSPALQADSLPAEL